MDALHTWLGSELGLANSANSGTDDGSGLSHLVEPGEVLEAAQEKL